MDLNRRSFLKGLGAALLVSQVPAILLPEGLIVPERRIFPAAVATLPFPQWYGAYVLFTDDMEIGGRKYRHYEQELRSQAVALGFEPYEVEIIYKHLGSCGTIDPLYQYDSMAWRAPWYRATPPRPEGTPPAKWREIQGFERFA
jgi:hypothetical protein